MTFRPRNSHNADAPSDPQALQSQVSVVRVPCERPHIQFSYPSGAPSKQQSGALDSPVAQPRPVQRTVSKGDYPNFPFSRNTPKIMLRIPGPATAMKTPLRVRRFTFWKPHLQQEFPRMCAHQNQLSLSLVSLIWTGIVSPSLLQP